MDQELKDSILKTGTTLVGIVCKDGVVMASDRQVTGGRSIVMHKNFKKTIQINDYLVISGCGIVSDFQRVSKLVAAELRLKELKSKARPSIKQAANLLANINYNGIRKPSMIPQQTALLIAGLNTDGSVNLYGIGAEGTAYEIEDYDASSGSGMPYVLGLLERQYKPGLSVQEGVELAKEALKSSTQRDTASGYGLDIFTITKDGIKKEVEQEIVPDYRDDKKEDKKK